MKISIITISFNQVAFIRQAIESVLNQGVEDFEYIVIDAGSTDGSRTIINEYQDRLLTVYEPDKGQADGLNKGISKASGHVVGFVNSDDILLPDALNKVIRFFSENPSVDVMLGRGYKVDQDLDILYPIFPDRFSLEKYAHQRFNFIQTATFFKRSALMDSGGFNLNNRTCWDGELLVDIALKGGLFKRSNEKLAAFRIYESSISGSGSNQDLYQKDRERIRQKITGSTATNPFQKSLLRLKNLIETPVKLTVPLQRRFYRYRKQKCV